MLVGTLSLCVSVVDVVLTGLFRSMVLRETGS